MAMLLSHSTNRYVVELYIYWSLTGIEFGMIKGLKMHKVEDAIIQMGMSKNIKGYQCADVIFGILILDLEKGWNPLPFEFFHRFIIICSAIFNMASIVLLFEIFRHKVEKK